MKTAIIPNDILVTEIDRLIKEGSQVAFTPKGFSMLPFIRGGRDTVLLTAPEEINIRDIVLARVAPNRYVLHRVINISEGEVELMGDGNLVGTERCRLEDVLALALEIRKDGKTIDCRSRKHLRRAGIWWALKPIRRYLLAVYRRIEK